jgi:hypothetical protein
MLKYPMKKILSKIFYLVFLVIVLIAVFLLIYNDTKSGRALSETRSASAESVSESSYQKLKSLNSVVIETASGSEAEKIRLHNIDLWNKRYVRAQDLYDRYRESSRYPFESRPISDAPDQIYPFRPYIHEYLLGDKGGVSNEDIVLSSGQDRIYLSGNDSVKFTVQLFDKKTGKVLPVTAISATAQSIPDVNGAVLPRSIRLDFSDAGAVSTSGIDEVPNDGKFTARLSPTAQGYAEFKGLIRSEVVVKSGSYEGKATFDVTFVETVPATWGGIRESQEFGSLNFYLKANVKVAGRYIVSSRVDDASGKPFAILYFQDELAAGDQEIKLNLFGALIHDKQPAFPLKLRDVSGYLLIADTNPDRMMMARREGIVHTSGMYSFDSFSPKEWESEERTRYLTEFGKKMDTARSELARLRAR